MLPRRVSLVRNLPPIIEAQTQKGACAAHAVVSLLEYQMDCRVRLSTAFLFAAMRIKVQEWLDRNLAAVMRGERGEADFESVFAENLAGLRCLMSSDKAESVQCRRFGEMFRATAIATFDSASGCPIRFVSEALVAFGICRHALWPEGGGSSAEPFAGNSPALPDFTREDARRRRLANGLDFLPEPGNVAAIKGVLAGTGGYRPMPVVIALDAYPDGRGAHAVLVVGYRDSESLPGGGEFFVRDDSIGARCARIDYAFLLAHCTEAATILQDKIDYAGDGYGGFRTRRKVRTALCVAGGMALMVVGGLGWHAWRTSAAVVDAPFEWLAHPVMDVERITVCGDATYGSCLKSTAGIKRCFFGEDVKARASVNFSTNGVASSVSAKPDVLLLFGRSVGRCCLDSDKESIAHYLADGGTVFAFVCECNRVMMGDLLSGYGLKIQSLPGKPPVRAVAPVLRDCQLDGFSYFRVTEMSDDWHALMVTDDDEQAPVMAFRRVGRGKLFCAPQQLVGNIGETRVKNVEWWDRLLFACVADALASDAEGQ